MDSNREKKLITNVCQIKGYCPNKYMPQIIKALQSNDTFEGFASTKQDKKGKEGVGAHTQTQAQKGELENGEEGEEKTD